MAEEPVTQAKLYSSNDSAQEEAHAADRLSTESLEPLMEPSENVYSELLGKNSRLGTLKVLCTAVLARFYGPSPCSLVAESPLLTQVHYDALDVDLPLEKCYQITEERYWKRVVLVKHHDKALAIKSNVHWKNLGVSLKLVEILEQCPVEYWLEEEMKELVLKIKEFVNELHIKRLQSLRERYFKQYFQSDTENSSSEESSFEEDDESVSSAIQEDLQGPNEEMLTKSESQLRLEAELAERKAQLKKERQEAKQKARERREAKRQRREARRLAEEEPTKKPRKKIPYTMFDINVSDSEDDSEYHVVDKRNKSLYLKYIKKYDYPAQDCHHIDLKFVQYLTNLETLILEFWGPLQGCHFHKRHHRFSLNDIKNLSFGLSHLSSLKIFRLRNSSMNAEKLLALCQALSVLPCLETLDFGFDQLGDDCDFVFEKLIATSKSLQSLELESNFLGEKCLYNIGNALRHYKDTPLQYLGLARNPLTDEALHALVMEIVGTNHIQHLNIRGIPFLSEHGICCCLANELLGKHSALTKLDICALPISTLAADEIVKALVKNQTILEINCKDCGLDLRTEIDINILMQRNKYISEHYYVGDYTVTTEEITKFLNRTKNPILLKVLAERAKFSGSEIHLSPAATTSDFDVAKYSARTLQPAPPERYYFKVFKQKFSLRDNINKKIYH